MNFPMLKATRGTIMLFVVIFVPGQKKIMLFYVTLLLTMFSMKGEVFVRRISSFPEMTLIAYKICCQPDLLAPNQTTYRNKEQLFS